MRITISGSHSVGKTSLLNAIHTPYKKIDEIARDVIQDKMPWDMTDKEFFDFEMRVAKKQIELEQGDFVIDRSIYDIMAYSEERLGYEGSKPIKDYLLTNSKGYDIIFYIPIEFPLEVDNKRKNDIEYQNRIDVLIVNNLLYASFNGKPTWELNGELGNRLRDFYRVVNLIKTISKVKTNI